MFNSSRLVHLRSIVSKAMGERTVRLTDLLQNELATTHLDIINESHKHGVPPGSETHLKIVVVTSQFTGVSRVKREQRVQGLLKDEMDKGLHAISIIAKTPEEWDKTTKEVSPSPDCRGGFGK